MSQKHLLAILKVGALLSLLSFFIIADSLYFPYITGKQLYFNILTEILLWFWFYLVTKFPETRPKNSLVTWGLVVWLAAVLASAIGGVDFNLSFWGDTERMLGWFSLIHFFALYLIVITVFRNKTDWQWLLNGSLAAAVILAIYAFATANGPKFQGNVNMMSNISTLGNATYVAGVMLLNFYFVIYLWSVTKNWLLKLWYLAAAALMLLAFNYANVSGSQAALVVSLLLFGLLLGLLHKNRRVKIISLSLTAAAVAVIVLAAVLAFRHAPLMNNKLGTAIRDFSANNVSLNARLFAWRAGWLGFQERPILGFGWGNFSTPFDKYFSVGLYRWTPGEEYYDRAHNMVVEMLATGGVLGLLSYLALFAAVIMSLIKAWRRQTIKPLALATVAALITAYFIHNLAVFDSLANFICFMLAAGLAFYLTAHSGEAVELSASRRPLTTREIINLIICGLALISLIYYGNWRPLLMLKSSVVTMRAWYNGDAPEFFSRYRQTLAYHTPLDRDIREVFIGLVTEQPNRLAGVSDRQISELLNSSLAASQANVNLNPRDYLTLIRHAQTLELVALLIDNEKLLNEALAAINQAIANGGQHSPAYMAKVNILLSLKDYPSATATFRQLLAIRPDYPAVYCRLAYLELYYQVPVAAADLWSNFDNCLDRGETDVLVKGDYLLKATAHYEANKDQARLKKLQAIMLAN